MLVRYSRFDYSLKCTELAIVAYSLAHTPQEKGAGDGPIPTHSHVLVAIPSPGQDDSFP